MSYFIDDFQPSFLPYSDSESTLNDSQMEHSRSKDVASEQSLRQIIRAIMPLSQNVEMIESKNETVTFSLLLSKVYQELSFNIRIIVSMRDLSVRMEYRPLSNNETYMTIPSMQRRVFVAKVISFFNKIGPSIFN